jgi:hypothetical protein
MSHSNWPNSIILLHLLASPHTLLMYNNPHAKKLAFTILYFNLPGYAPPY